MSNNAASPALMQPIVRRHPCRECPFRRDGIKHLGERANDIVDAICKGERFHCHKTLEIGEDGLSTENGKPCIGALMSVVDAEGVMSIEEFLEVQHQI